MYYFHFLFRVSGFGFQGSSFGIRVSGFGFWGFRFRVPGLLEGVGGVGRVAHEGREFFFFTLVTGPRRSLRLKLSDTRVYEPQIRARLGTTAQFCRVVVFKRCDLDSVMT